MGQNADMVVAKLRSALAWRLGARYALGAAGVAMFAMGGLVLLVRLCGWPSHWALGCFAPVALAAGVLATVRHLRRNVPASAQLLAWLDDECCAHGLLLAGAERGDWPLPDLRAPRLRVNWLREALWGAVGLVFVVIAWTLPIHPLAENMPTRLDIQDETAKLSEQLAVLEKERLLPEEQVTELKTLLAEIAERNEAAEAARTYQLLDALEERISQGSNQAFAELQDTAHNREKLAEALEALRLENRERAALEAELQQVLDKLMKEDAELKGLMQQALGEQEGQSIDLAELSTEQLRELVNSLKENASSLRERLKKAQEGGCSVTLRMSGGETLRQWLEAQGQGGLAQQLGQGGEGGQAKDGKADGGKADDGPAHGDGGSAPLDLSGQTKRLQAQEGFEGQLQSETLPADSPLLRKYYTAPANQDEAPKAPQAGNLRGQSQAGGEREAVHPQHRQAVRRYFDSTPATK
ncbi:MAG: hypothetical protein IJJ33_02930 [Victivallales bacterium]|nr:hypothetical protein [Victivallales bacterium]